MLSCFPSSLEYGDIIGFNNDEFVAGKVVSISIDENKFWIIVIKLEDDRCVSTYLSSKGRVMLIKMKDGNNPARTRNNKNNWTALGIKSKAVSNVDFY